MKTRILTFIIVCIAIMAFASGPYNHFSSGFFTGEADTLPIPDSVVPNSSDTLKHPVHSLKGGRYISKEELDSLLKDSVPEHSFTILPDTTKKDTVPVDTSANSNVLDAPVKYEAKDSIVFDYRNSRAHLYGESKDAWKDTCL